MPLKITNKQVKIHTDFHEFMPRWDLEKKEYEQAKFTSLDERPHTSSKSKGDLADFTHWQRIPPTEEIAYYSFLDKITDKSKNRFHPARDEDRRPIPKTGAMHVITDIIRLKIEEDNKEFLLTKGNIIGHDAAGEELSFYLSFPELWFKTLFTWSNEYDNNSKSFIKKCLGPSGGEKIYLLEFTKDNAKSLFEQRANDKLNFIVKDEISDEAKRVEPDVNAQKTFERFANNSFDFLW